MTLQVTGSSLNVREGPTTSRPTVAKVRKGDSLVVLAQEGSWYQVRLADDKTGWVNAKYVRRQEPCLPDKATAEILNEPDEVLRPSAGNGRVVLEATVSARGTVVATKLLENSTGGAVQLRQAETELRALKFAPPVRKCRPVSFIYVYTKNF